MNKRPTSLELNRRQFVAALGAFTAFPRLLPAQGAPTAGDQISFGADYYVEDWPVERLGIDAQLMARAGFTTVRLIDTNWQRLEPAEGQYSFAWLDHALQVLNRNGIRAVLCTSSYAPPFWLTAQHPDIHLVDEEGHRYPSGGMGF